MTTDAGNHIIVTGQNADGTFRARLVAANEDPYIVGYVNRVQSISYAANGAAALAQTGASAMTTPRTGTVGTGSNTYSPRNDFVQGQQISRSDADDFYRSAGYSEVDAANHSRGIDFSKPVYATTLPKGTIVIQYVDPVRGVGNYFAPPGVPASQLGFYSGGKILNTFTATKTLLCFNQLLVKSLMIGALAEQRIGKCKHKAAGFNTLAQIKVHGVRNDYIKNS